MLSDERIAQLTATLGRWLAGEPVDTADLLRILREDVPELLAEREKLRAPSEMATLSEERVAAIRANADRVPALGYLITELFSEDAAYAVHRLARRDIPDLLAEREALLARIAELEQKRHAER